MARIETIVPVIASTYSEFKTFKDSATASPIGLKIVRITNSAMLRGFRPAKLVVLPEGIRSLKKHEWDSILAYCARHSISIYRVRPNQLAAMYNEVATEGDPND